MVTRIGGNRRKTRAILSKPRRQRGKVSQRRYFQEFSQGDKVALKAEPAVQKGMYFPRFHGLIGTVGKRLGTCYEVLVSDQGREKRLVVHPVHLRRMNA